MPSALCSALEPLDRVWGAACGAGAEVLVQGEDLLCIMEGAGPAPG